MPFPKCKPSLDMFIDPSLGVMKNILAIEVIFKFYIYIYLKKKFLFLF